jgi:hypothetical protein
VEDLGRAGVRRLVREMAYSDRTEERENLDKDIVRIQMNARQKSI